MPPIIIKADGTQEAFDRSKLLQSLHKSGASNTTAEDIVVKIESSLKSNMHTDVIYRHAFEILRKHEPQGPAARYSLRRALMDLGPSGFPFESYLAELFRTEGFEAVTNLIINGKCVEHEIDVLLKKDGVNTYVEAKFHNTPGFKTDLKVALYVKARIDDLRSVDPHAKGLLVTNTKLTSMAFAYARCAGLDVLTWDFPRGNSLQDLVERAKLYPTTALASLSKKEKEVLLLQKVVLCKNIPQHSDILRGLGIGERRLTTLFDEIAQICG